MRVDIMVFIKSGIFFVFIMCLSANGFCAEYYVSTTGNNGASGTVTTPWRTLQYAVDTISEGDTIIVESGTYAGFRSASGGTQALPNTIKARNNGTVVLNSLSPDNWHGSIIEIEGHDWWVIIGFEVTGSATRAGIDVREADHVTVRNCFCHHNYRWGIFTAFTDFLVLENNECSYSSDEHGIYVSNSSDNCFIRYNIVHDNIASGIQINADPSMGDDGISSYCVVSHNKIYNNGAAGGAAINLASVRNSLIANNLIYNNSAGGIAGWDDDQGNQWGTKNNKIYNNTIHQPATGRWAINLNHGSSGNSIQNNILIHDSTYRGSLEFDSSSLTSLVSDYNIIRRISIDENVISLASWQSGYSHDLNSMDSVPNDIFTPAANDYHLFKDSVAVDRGVLLLDIVDDLDGKKRPQGTGYDMGAYEYQFPAAKNINAPVNFLLLN